MNSVRLFSWLASLALACSSTAAQADAPPATPPAAIAVGVPGLKLELVEKKPLRLVRYIYDKKSKSAVVGLEGSLEVRLTNSSAPGRALALPKHDVHGFVFRPLDGGEPFIVVHTCQCLLDAQATTREVIHLAPGEEKALLFADWGCSGGFWPAPPPGIYLVSYRTLVLPDNAAPPTPSGEPPAAILKQCREKLRAEAAWKDAVSSNAIQVVLGKPIPIRPPGIK